MGNLANDGTSMKKFNLALDDVKLLENLPDSKKTWRHDMATYRLKGIALEDLAYFARDDIMANFNGAIAAFDTAIEKYDGEGHLYLDRGRCKFRRSEVFPEFPLEDAADDLTTAIGHLDDKSLLKSEAYLWLAKVQREQAKKTTGEQKVEWNKKADESIKTSVELVKKNNSTQLPEYQLSQALDNLSQGHIEIAQRLLQDLLRNAKPSDPLWSTAQEHLGLCYWFQGNHKSAEASFRAALPKKPEDEGFITDASISVQHFGALTLLVDCVFRRVMETTAIHKKSEIDDMSRAILRANAAYWKSRHTAFRSAGEKGKKIAENYKDIRQTSRYYKALRAMALIRLCEITWGEQGDGAPDEARDLQLHIEALDFLNTGIKAAADKKYRVSARDKILFASTTESALSALKKVHSAASREDKDKLSNVYRNKAITLMEEVEEDADGEHRKYTTKRWQQYLRAAGNLKMNLRNWSP